MAAGAVLTTPEDFVNSALGDIGAKGRIGSLLEGSESAKQALNIYGQTRDALLRSKDWGFAEGNTVLELLKTAPLGGYTPPVSWTPDYPILPWFYEYLYPDDCLKIRALRGSNPSPIPIFDPKPINFRVANDATICAPSKVILTNLPSAVLVYTRQVMDPVNWEPMFGEALIDALGKRLAPVKASLDAAKLEAQQEVVDTQQAIMTVG